MSLFTAQEPTSQAGVVEMQLPQAQSILVQPIQGQQHAQAVSISSSGESVTSTPQENYQTEPAPAVQVTQQQSAMVTANTIVNATSDAPQPGSYEEIVGKLNNLWDNQMTEIQNVTEDHWKSPEFPLARIKKIMRMDEDVRMISAEVPVMFSKALEMFITELSLRAWLQTEESKRRTVQRSDIAMAITKHDMFDFLIDIVPREEIQLKAKSTKSGEGENLQLLPPDVLQMYIQQIAQQAFTGGDGGGSEEGVAATEGEGGSDSSIGLLQQLQVLQQLMQLQQEHIEQQQSTSSLGQTVQLQHPVTVGDPGHASGTIQPQQLGQAATPNPTTTQVLYTSGNQGIQANQDQVQMTRALEHLTGAQLTPSSTETYITSGQQTTLHHVDPPHTEYHQPQQLLEPVQQQLQQGNSNRSATVVIQPPLMEPHGDQQSQQQTPITTHTLLDAGSHGGQYLNLEQATQQSGHHHHHHHFTQQQQNLLENIVEVLVQPQTVSQAEQFVSHTVQVQSDSNQTPTVTLSDQLTAARPIGVDGGEQPGVGFHSIPESGSITVRLSSPSDDVHGVYTS